MSSTESEILTIPKHMLPFHDHPLTCAELDSNIWCHLCSTNASESRIAYHCTECELSLHKECIEHFLNQPFLCNHFLKIIVTSSTTLEYANHHRCHFSHSLWNVFAHCTICNIYICLFCVKKPPPVTIFQPKHHKHNLTLLSRLVTFTCNACGVEGDRNPYVCLECNLMLHKDCIDLPRVISINRHDHRISNTFHLGQGDWECGVCRKTIDWVYGAFKCSRCPSYAVHSKCATRYEVWDGKELEDVPEVEEEIEDPFEVINETDIIHFSHENHILRWNENCVVDAMRCDGCVLPLNGYPCYKCLECDFILHKECASLPRKKRHLLHNHKLTLKVRKEENLHFQCKACKMFSNGFKYECVHEDCDENHKIYDVRCSFVSEPFHHDLHPHPLYWTLDGSKTCKACGNRIKRPLSCVVCEYALCIWCATLPKKVQHICDGHFLSLCHDAGNSSGDLWCDICETKTDPSVCYYTCDKCGLSLHIKCVLGDLYYTKLGYIDPTDSSVEVLANNGATRPLCIGCKDRCKFPFLMRLPRDRYICSMECIFFLSSSDEDC